MVRHRALEAAWIPRPQKPSVIKPQMGITAFGPTSNDPREPSEAMNQGRTSMNMQRYTKIGLLIGAMALAFGIGTVVGEQAPPTENKGVQISAPVAIDLAPWADDMKGRQLRIRKLNVEPGGVLGIHSHDDRPDASYLVQGTLTEYRAGGYIKVRSNDTLSTAGKGITHWVENKGTSPAVLIVVDVFKQP